MIILIFWKEIYHYNKYSIQNLDFKKCKNKQFL